MIKSEYQRHKNNVSSKSVMGDYMIIYCRISEKAKVQTASNEQDA